MKLQNLFQKVIDCFNVIKLKRYLKELDKLQASIHWSMQFDYLTEDEIETNNRKLFDIELDRRITVEELNSYNA